MFRRAKRRTADERGIALLIVVSLMTVIVVMGAAFAFSMHLETRETRQFVSTGQARYIAEAGIAYARALLDEDDLASREDAAGDVWVTYPQGSDVDVDGDGAADARWFPVQDAAQEATGRYAVFITDEAGKINVNAGYADPAGIVPGAINLTWLLERSGLPHARAEQAARAIEAYRQGPDGKPGLAGIDDDRDGAIDDPDEYQPLALGADDRRIDVLEELSAIAGLSAEELSRVGRVATVYSWDPNLTVGGVPRVNLVTATAEELLAVLLDIGMADPWQAAVNMADFADADVEMSRVTRSSQALTMADEGPIGAWDWQADPAGHYRTSEPDGEPLVWTITAPSGTFRLLARGLEGMLVGDVTVEGQTTPSVANGESLGVFALDGQLEIRVVHREAQGTVCAFRGIELVPQEPSGGRAIRGIEAVRFNELMVEPARSLAVSDATFDAQGSDWACPTGSPTCVISGVGQARWSWEDPLLAPGRYYVRVFGAATGQTVGDVRVDGETAHLVHGQSHPATALVGSDHRVSLTLGKSDAEGTYYFQKAELSLQPDAEYVELINLSDRDMDVGGWVIDGELAGGRSARLPAGAVIKAHGLLVAAVDLSDTQEGLEQNGISARDAWEIGDGVAAVQLEFPAGGPSPDDDWLKVSLGAGVTPRLTLRSAEAIVDEVEYAIPLVMPAAFQSLEKGDPSVVVDADADGVDDGWHPSLALFTAGTANDNDGLKETVEGQTVVHDSLTEVLVLNRPLGGVGELAGLPSGEPWKPFASEDLARIVDRFTVEGHRLEAEGHLLEELDGAGAWEERADGTYVHTDSDELDVAGRWRWTGVVSGEYRLSLYGWPGEQMAVRWEQPDGAPSDWSPALSTDAQGRIVVGHVQVGVAGGASASLTIDARCASPGGVCHVDYVQLDPRLLRVGPVNINTAGVDALLSLPGMTEGIASRIMQGRPYGDRDGRARGIGDLLTDETLGSTEEDRLEVFRQMAHLLTTRSSVFQILSLGEVLQDERPLASQRIQAVVER